MFEGFENKTDEEIREIVEQGQAILGRRAEERKQQALERIRQIAAEADLDGHWVNGKKKRGRPPRKRAVSVS